MSPPDHPAETGRHSQPPRGPTIAPVKRGRRLFLFFSIPVVLTGGASLLFADLLWRNNGWSDGKSFILGLFAILFCLAAFGCTHGIYGFFIRRFGDRGRITQKADYHAQDISGSSTAIVIPIYNEDVSRVFAGLRAIHEAVRDTGQLERFEFYVLSDSNQPEKWIEEETAWFQLARELGGFATIHYRRRTNNEGKKSGNVRDFLRAWGTRHRYMIVLDADSIMTGEALVDLVRLMEANPQVGLIQTVPVLVRGESFFGRAQQFANRFYGPLFTAGLNYWVQDGGNYWGHNAIMRVEPFMAHCDLPQLPGKKPFGGQILSHDFVEAALLRRTDWEVWLAWDLEGSYEEGPQGIIEHAQRDRRWCQGNLQHGMLLFAKGLRGISRLHLSLGILGYLSSPLWLLFLLLGTWLVARRRLLEGNLSDLPAVEAFTPYLRIGAEAHGLLVFGITMTILFLPKIFGLLDTICDPARRRSFGGLAAVFSSVCVEIIVSTLLAPVLMLFHTKFVISILLGQGVNWGPQKRVADGTAWSTACSAHFGQTLVGLGWGCFAWYLSPEWFYWFVPVLVGMVFSIPLSVWFSRRSWGMAARRMGLFLTPEELAPPPVLRHLAELEEAPCRSDLSGPADLGSGESLIVRAVIDPYVNAVHVTLLREKALNPEYAGEMAALSGPQGRSEELRERLLADGPGALSALENLALLSDVDSMTWLHSQVWIRPAESLHGLWQRYFLEFGA